MVHFSLQQGLEPLGIELGKGAVIDRPREFGVAQAIAGQWREQLSNIAAVPVGAFVQILTVVE